MSQERKRTLLRSLSVGPRTEQSFTSNAGDSIAPIHIKKYLGELCRDGYITVDMRDTFRITPAGLALLADDSGKTPPRQYGNASMPSDDPYRSPRWPSAEARPANRQHFDYRSLGAPT